MEEDYKDEDNYDLIKTIFDEIKDEIKQIENDENYSRNISGETEHTISSNNQTNIADASVTKNICIEEYINFLKRKKNDYEQKKKLYTLEYIKKCDIKRFTYTNMILFFKNFKKIVISEKKCVLCNKYVCMSTIFLCRYNKKKEEQVKEEKEKEQGKEQEKEEETEKEKEKVKTKGEIEKEKEETEKEKEETEKEKEETEKKKEETEKEKEETEKKNENEETRKEETEETGKEETEEVGKEETEEVGKEETDKIGKEEKEEKKIETTNEKPFCECLETLSYPDKYQINGPDTDYFCVQSLFTLNKEFVEKLKPNVAMKDYQRNFNFFEYYSKYMFSNLFFQEQESEVTESLPSEKVYLKKFIPKPDLTIDDVKVLNSHIYKFTPFIKIFHVQPHHTNVAKMLIIEALKTVGNLHLNYKIDRSTIMVFAYLCNIHNLVLRIEMETLLCTYSRKHFEFFLHYLLRGNAKIVSDPLYLNVLFGHIIDKIYQRKYLSHPMLNI